MALAIALLGNVVGCAGPATGGDPETSPGNDVSGVAIGADLSFLPQLEAAGAEYAVAGVRGDPLTIFRDHGFTLVRLRLWHTPEEPWHGLDATVDFARRVRDEGFEIMLDLHYSDSWADPGKQVKPEAWRDADFPALVDSVREYTSAVVRRFADADVLPRYIQLGNEIGGGLLWDDGRVGWEGGPHDTWEQWSQLTELLAAAAEGVRRAQPAGSSPAIVLHVADGGDNEACRWFFDRVVAAGTEFDAIGLSFYPWWHGELGDLETNVHDLARRYGKEILVVETGYPWTLSWWDDTHNFVGEPAQLHPGYGASPGSQERFLRDLVAVVAGIPRGLGRGVIYWEPAWTAVDDGPPNPYENLALFDFHWDALPALGFGLPR
jgi:arabinogalactan endo-1,4-beta-galactosidase